MEASDNTGRFIGLMSGTSLDAVDAVLVRFGGASSHMLVDMEIEATHSEPLPAHLRDLILDLNRPGGNDEIERMGKLDRELGGVFATAANTLMAIADISAATVRAIGSHGQTLRHRPPGQIDPTQAFTTQIGDAATIAELTGITTVADFRRRDIAAGGQGAPLAPAFHEAVFASPIQRRAVVNIGGMTNLTLLFPGETLQGFDIGPGNVLMDAWCQRQRGQPYDVAGGWASSGTVHRGLLRSLRAHPFFGLAPPKSTGREAFNLQWLETALTREAVVPSPADVQATLLELTARSIGDAISAAGAVDAVFCCGGGAYNRHLMRRLADLLEPRPVATTAQLGLAPEWVEAAAFAWLARRTLTGLSGNAATVTGARGARVLGAIYPA